MRFKRLICKYNSLTDIRHGQYDFEKSQLASQLRGKINYLTFIELKAEWRKTYYAKIGN